MQPYGQSPPQPGTPTPGGPVGVGAPGSVPPGYGTPALPVPAGQAYGTPGAQQPVLPPAEIKWSGLEVGGAFHLPVTSFIGRLTDMVEDTQSQYGLRIIEKFDQVQILASPVPWPWATIDPSIKYSSKENSNWGKHIASAKALGLAVNASTLAEAKADLIGKTFEMHQESESYGEDKQTGQKMVGDVWKFVRIVTPGAAPIAAQPSAQPAPAAPAVATPVVPVPAVTPAVTPTATVQPVVATTPTPAPVATPTPPPAGAFDATLSPDDTAAIRAKKLLHTRALNEWLGVALVDDKIKGDAAFINTIYDQSFIVGLKGSGQVTQGTDGKFVVTS